MNFRKEVTLESPVSPTSLFDIGGIMKVILQNVSHVAEISIFGAISNGTMVFFLAAVR